MELVYFAILGAFGALIRETIKGRGMIILPRKWKNRKKSGIDLGILSAMLIGAAMAMLVDREPLTAFFAAMACPHILEEVIKIKRNGWRS